MIVGVMTVELALREAQTLKDKRRVLQSLKQRLHQTFNVSVAEVDFNDMPKRSRLGIALVCNESRPIHTQFDRMIDLVRGAAGLTLLDYSREML